MRFIAVALSLAALCVVPAAHSQAPANAQLAQAPVASEQNVDARIADMLGNPAEFRSFFKQLKEAVAASDKQTLAKMMNYPLRVSDDKLKVRTEKDFIKHYDKIFTPEVNAVVKEQTYADLFVRDQGASMGSGELWFTGICLDNACKQRTPKVISVFAP